MQTLPITGTIALMIVLATIVEMAIEYFAKPLLDTIKAAAPALANFPFARYLSLAAAIALALWYAVDVVAYLVPHVTPSVAGMLLTACLIARGANYLHDWIANPILDRLLR